MPYGYEQRVWDAAKREAKTILQARAKRRANQTITYAELAAEITAIRFRAEESAFHQMLGEISVEEHKRTMGMLSVLVVLKDSLQPGGGFFKLAKELGHDVRDKTAFFIEELNRVIAA